MGGVAAECLNKVRGVEKYICGNAAANGVNINDSEVEDVLKMDISPVFLVSYLRDMKDLMGILKLLMEGL